MSALSWVFAVVTLLGGGFFIASLIIGSLGEWLGDMFDGVDSTVENLTGVDLTPDDAPEHGSKGLGCVTILAFFTGFGAAGLIASLYDVGPFFSILIGAGFGALAAFLYVTLMKLLLKQQSNSVITDKDVVGKTAVVVVTIPQDSVGEIRLTAQGGLTTYSAYSANHKAIPKGRSVKIVSLEGGKAYVEQAE